MRRIIAITILLAILFSFNMAYAAEPTGTQKAAAEPTGTQKAAAEPTGTQKAAAGTINTDKTTAAAINITSVIKADTVYTIVMLQEMAAGASRRAMMDDVEIKKKDMAVRTVRSDSTAMSDSIRSVTRPMEVKLELEAARKTKQDNLNKLRAEVYRAALSIQLSGKEIELQEQKLAIANDKLEMAKARFRAAAITRDDLDSVQYSVDSCKVNLTGAREKLNSLYLELRSLLNQPLDTAPVKLEADLEPEAFEELDVDLALSSLYKNETSVFKASGKLDVAQKAMEIASKLYREGDLAYDNCVSDLEEAKLDLAGAKTALEVKVRNAYNDMANRLDNVELAVKYAELAGKKLANAQVKYNRGTIGREAFLSAKEGSMDAEYAKFSAIADFNVSRMELRNMLELE